MQAQQLSVKLFAADPAAVVLDAFPPIFHRWIQESRIPHQLLIDVADYRHVPDGPGILLVGHQAHYAIDSERGPLGLLYSVKRDEPGELDGKLVEAFGDALAAARALEDDPARPIRFRGDRLRVAVMSRRLAPNSAETFAAARPALEVFAARVYPGRGPSIEHLADPREPFSVEIAVDGATALADLGQVS